MAGNRFSILVHFCVQMHPVEGGRAPLQTKAGEVYTIYICLSGAAGINEVHSCSRRSLLLVYAQRLFRPSVMHLHLHQRVHGTSLQSCERELTSRSVSLQLSLKCLGAH